jgi:bleomycin hydrolase
MKKVLVMFLCTVTSCITAIGQTTRHITPAVLEALEQSCPRDGQMKAAHHVLAQVDGNKISQDWETTIGVDQYFSLRLRDQKITDQKGTGRCWMFSGLNILRPIVSHTLGVPEIELSQAFLFFYEKLEKANLFLDVVIQTKDKPYTDRTVEYLFKQNVQDGQNWLGFIELVGKYGVVPKDVMPETFSSSNSGHVNKVLSMRLKRAAMDIRQQSSPENLSQLKLQALKDVYKILALNFGVPPKSFDWRYETKEKKLLTLNTYSPRQFYTEFAGHVLEDYYPFYSIPTLAFNKKYEIDLDRTVSDQPNLFFVNVTLDTMKTWRNGHSSTATPCGSAATWDSSQTARTDS